MSVFIVKLGVSYSMAVIYMCVYIYIYIYRGLPDFPKMGVHGTHLIII